MVQNAESSKSQKESKLSLYSFFLLFVFAATRSIFTVQKNAIGYAFGYNGIGEQATAQFMITKSFPNLAPIYGFVSTLTFATTYCIMNVGLSGLSKNWNKRIMLATAVLGFSLMTLG